MSHDIQVPAATYTIATGARGPQGPPGAVETTATILEKLQGAEADPDRIGAEYIPNAIVIPTGDPNDPEGLTTVEASHIGQLVLVEDTGAWYIWNGAEWLQLAPTPLTRTAAEGSPVGVVTPAYVGQKCIVGGPVSANRVEFTSLDGTTWTLTGPAGVIASASGYVRATHDGTSITYSSYPLS